MEIHKFMELEEGGSDSDSMDEDYTKYVQTEKEQREIPPLWKCA